MTNPKIRSGRARRLVGVCVLLALLIAACGDDDAATSSSDDGTTAGFARDGSGDEGGGDDGGAFEVEAGTDGSGNRADRPAANAQGGGADGGNPTLASNLTPADFGRSIVYVATTEVIVEDVSLATSQAKTAIAGLGGLLFGEDTQKGESNRTTLEFKVFPEDFQEALHRLDGLGELHSQSVTADDVTARVVDLESRIRTGEVSVERLRDLLAEARVLEDIARLELQLLERETGLETLRGQRRTLEDQVSLATILLTLREPVPPRVQAQSEYEVTFYDGDDGGLRCAAGFDELEVDEGELYTVCVGILNTGNTAIGEIEVRDDGLNLRSRDFRFADAESDVILLPGERVFAWAAAEAPARGRSRVAIAAVAVDDKGVSLRVGAEVEQVNDPDLRFVENDALPGFGDALGASWSAMLSIVGVLVLAVGLLVPFLWVLPVAWLGRRWWLGRGPRPIAPKPLAD